LKFEKIEDVIRANKQSGFNTRQEFIEAAVNALLQNLAGIHEKSFNKASNS